MAILDETATALLDETATALSVGFGEEGKRRPLNRWFSSKRRPTISLSIIGSMRRRTTVTASA
ncbi:hypothetical protein Bca52824_023211 [Brassica carinata]|uniref:Uncharacterized protein n=1 Tax=Brassica carinata TaxID=52824 RepID=A0A8X7VHS4_BRACI|nr:hypothetical protein Bca52824_023211 [Brassica carinata]